MLGSTLFFFLLVTNYVHFFKWPHCKSQLLHLAVSFLRPISLSRRQNYHSLILLKPHRFLRCHVIKPIIKTKKKNICIQKTALPVNTQQTCTQSISGHNMTKFRGQMLFTQVTRNNPNLMHLIWKITPCKITCCFYTDKNNLNLSLRNMIVTGFIFTELKLERLLNPSS